MGADEGNAKKEALSAIVAKLRSQILLFSLAIALVIVSAFGLAGRDALWPIAGVLLVFLVGAGLYAFVERVKPEAGADGGRAKDEVTGGRPLGAIRDGAAGDLRVEVWCRGVADRESSAAYKIGTKIRICVRATEDCYLTLLNVGSDGELTVLFPNRLHQDNRIVRDRIYEIPDAGYAFDFTLEGPAGPDEVKAIVTLDAKPLLETDFTKTGEFFHRMESSAAPRAIRVIAREVETRDARKWASASTRFLVENP